MKLPVLETQRLQLRALKDADENFIFSLRSNEQVNKFIDRDPSTHVEQARAFISKVNSSIAEGKSYYWAIVLKETDEMIGTICLWNLSDDRKTAELGYELHPDRQGKGYMNEAIKEVIGFVFRISFSTLEAYTHKDNEASTKLLLKQGFVLQADRQDPGNPDLLVFTLSVM